LDFLDTPGVGQPMAAKAGCFLKEADGTWVTAKVWVRLESEVRNSLLEGDPLWSAPTLPSSPLQYRVLQRQTENRMHHKTRHTKRWIKLTKP